MEQKILKLGLLIDDVTIPTWLYYSLEKLQHDGFANIALLIKSPLYQKKRSSFLYNTYQKIDQKLFGISNDAKRRKSYNVLFLNTSKCDINEKSEIKNFDLDIIIDISNQKQSTKLITCVKYGIWSYEGISNYQHFYEIIAKKLLLTSSLVMENKNDKIILSTSSSQIFGYSVFRDENEQLWSLASLLPAEIKKLSKLGERRYFEEKKDLELQSSEIAVPSNLFMILTLLKQSLRVVKKIIEKQFFKEQWFLMYKDRDDLSSESVSKFQTIMPSVKQFWADPFVVDYKDKRYIFIEEEPLNSHGYISLITLEDDGSFSEAVPLIKKPYHMSYPFVFNHNDTYYMIPETSENRTIDLYVAIDFPYKWEFKQNLMSDIHAVDTTLFYKDDKWWLFTSIAEFESGWDNGTVSLFFSDNLFSNLWNEHPQNPISTDPHHARMAGCVFEKEGKMYRPSQNSSKRYGYGFNIEEITKLSPTHYEEKTVSEIVPDWNKNILGTHTVNFAKNFTIIDGVHMRSRFK